MIFKRSTRTWSTKIRNYDPQSARFLTKDPLGPQQGGDINPYRYVHNNPVNATDPMGLCEPISGTALLIGAGVGAVAGGGAAYLSEGVRSVAAATAIGAAAGATSVVAGAYAVGFAAASFVGGGIGVAANVSTQYATGATNLNWTSAGIAGIAGAVGGVAGVAAGNAASFASPVIGNPVGVGAAVRAGQIGNALGGGVASGVTETGWNSVWGR